LIAGLLLLGALSGAPSGALAAPPAAAATPVPSPVPAGYAVRARLEPAVVTIGDRVSVVVEVDVPASATVASPRLDPPPRRWGDAEVAKSAAALPVGGHAGRFDLRLELAAFRTGRIDLPPLQIVAAPPAGATGAVRLQTPRLAFTVRSVLPKAEAKPTPMPPAPPLPLPLGAVFWWLLAGLLATAVGLALLLARARHRLARPQIVRPALPPLEEFLAEVDALATEPSLEAVHTRHSMALRRLVGALLHYPAPERTTSEIDQQLRQSRLATPTRRRLLDLLRRCDEVKFAARPVTRQDAAERLAASRALAGEVQHELQPPPPPAVLPERRDEEAA
jgi:hypothetical protein